MPFKTGTPTAIDVCCCQGAATRGYELAGWDVAAGIDVVAQPRYVNPGRFIQVDALSWLDRGTVRDYIREQVDLVHMSPPCQRYSKCQRIQGREHPDMIAAMRDLVADLDVMYVIENVGDAVPELRDPVMLCGSMFYGLSRTYRHRYFEAGGGLVLPQRPHGWHDKPQAKMGRAPKPGEVIQAVGNFSGVQLVREEWGVHWMNRDGIREAFPPFYTAWVGDRAMEQLRAAA